MASTGVRYGNIYIDFRYRGIRCREQTRLEDTPSNRKRAKQILERIEAEITLNTFDYAKYFPKSKRVAQFVVHDTLKDHVSSAVPTLADFSEVWLAENEVTWRFSHKETVDLTLRKYLVATFGETPMDKITRPEILAFRASLVKKPRHNGTIGLSPARINTILMILAQILREGAARYNFISPCIGIKALKRQKTPIEPFSLAEVSLLIETVRPDYKNYLIVRFFTGMRTGEVDGLKWEYVDFERREILVRETWTRERTEYTKNDGSQREIQMSPPVYDALLAQKTVTGKSPYVFCNRDGNPLCNRNFTNRVWHPLLRYLDLKKRRPYQTRHTAATLWLSSGESPEWIARQMGHTTTEMLFTVYSRFVPNLTRQDGSAIERLLATRFPTAPSSTEHTTPESTNAPKEANND